MSDKVHVQNLRGNTASNDGYLGKEGELVVNLESHSLRVHDGVTTGGHGTVYAASSETAAYAAMNDLAEGAIVIVGTSTPYKLYQKIGANLVLKDLEADVDIHKGTITTAGEEGSLTIRKLGYDYYFDVNFPFVEAVVNKGTVKVEGTTGSLNVTKNGTSNYTIDATFPEVPVPSDVSPKTPAADAIAGNSKDFARADHQHPLVFEKGTVTNGTTADVSFERDGHKVKLNMVDPKYAGYSTSESASEELAATMPDGAVIIERIDDKPFLKQKVGSDLVTTQLGGIQATYTEDSDETASILDDVEEGALIVEGTGPIVIDADVPISAVSGNTLERRADGLFHPKNTAITANAAETEAILPNLAEGTIIIEGPGEILVETAARVSSDEDNIITSMSDGISVNGKQILQSVFDALHPVGSYVLGTKPTIGTWVQAGQTKILSNSDDQYIVTEAGRYDIGTIPTGTSKGYTITPTKTGYDCIGIIPIWGGGRYYSSCVATISNGGTATARTCYVGLWNNSSTLASEDMFVAWTAIFRSKYGTEVVTKWKRTA